MNSETGQNHWFASEYSTHLEPVTLDTMLVCMHLTAWKCLYSWLIACLHLHHSRLITTVRLRLLTVYLHLKCCTLIIKTYSLSFSRFGFSVPHVFSCTILQASGGELIQRKNCRLFLHALVWCYCPNWHCSDRRDDTLHFRDICQNSVLEQFIDVYDGMGLPALIIVNKNV